MYWRCVSPRPRPRHIQRIFPQVFDGAAVYGIGRLSGLFFSYDLYAGNGEDNPGSGDQNATTAYGVKLEVGLPQLTQFDIGASFYQDGNLTSTGADKTAYGLHAKLRLRQLTLQSEYATGKYRDTPAGAFDRKGYYVQLTYDRNKWTTGYRHDFYDEDTTNLRDETVNSVFINYLVTKDINLKLERHRVEDDDAGVDDYDKSIASIAVNLGN